MTTRTWAEVHPSVKWGPESGNEAVGIYFCIECERGIRATDDQVYDPDSELNEWLAHHEH